jgi:hypothetical protein
MIGENFALRQQAAQSPGIAAAGRFFDHRGKSGLRFGVFALRLQALPQPKLRRQQIRRSRHIAHDQEISLLGKRKRAGLARLLGKRKNFAADVGFVVGAAEALERLIGLQRTVELAALYEQAASKRCRSCGCEDCAKLARWRHGVEI